MSIVFSILFLNLLIEFDYKRWWLLKTNEACQLVMQSATHFLKFKVCVHNTLWIDYYDVWVMICLKRYNIHTPHKSYNYFYNILCFFINEWIDISHNNIIVYFRSYIQSCGLASLSVQVGMRAVWAWSRPAILRTGSPFHKRG